MDRSVARFVATRPVNVLPRFFYLRKSENLILFIYSGFDQATTSTLVVVDEYQPLVDVTRKFSPHPRFVSPASTINYLFHFG